MYYNLSRNLPSQDKVSSFYRPQRKMQAWLDEGGNALNRLLAIPAGLIEAVLNIFSKLRIFFDTLKTAVTKILEYDKDDGYSLANFKDITYKFERVLQSIGDIAIEILFTPVKTFYQIYGRTFHPQKTYEYYY